MTKFDEIEKCSTLRGQENIWDVMGGEQKNAFRKEFVSPSTYKNFSPVTAGKGGCRQPLILLAKKSRTRIFWFLIRSLITSENEEISKNTLTF